MGNIHVICKELMEIAIQKIKHTTLTTKRYYKDKIITKQYVCRIAIWNWFLNRYYPKADLLFEQTHYIKIKN